jgi:hypothetical protein
MSHLFWGSWNLVMPCGIDWLQVNEIAGLSRQPLAVLSLLQHHKKHKFSRQLPTHTQKEKNCSAVTVVNICSIAYTLANSVLRIAKESLHHN